MTYINYQYQQHQQLIHRLLRRQQLLSRHNNNVLQQLHTPLMEQPPLHQYHRYFGTMTNSTRKSTGSSPLIISELLLTRRNQSQTTHYNNYNMFHPLLCGRIYPHPQQQLHWFSSSSSSSSGGFDPSGLDPPVIPPSSSFYDPKTNEPAGLRLVLDGMKRMENQITNIERDIEGIKNIVKKIRDSNGRTEGRLDMIEDFGDTMQQELYLTMDMVRVMIEKLAPKEDDGTKTRNDPPSFSPPNPNIAATKEAAATANARAKRQQYHRENNKDNFNETNSPNYTGNDRGRK